MRAPQDDDATGARRADDRYRAARRSHDGCMVCGDPAINPDSLALAFARNPDGSVSAGCGLARRYQGYDRMLHGGMISTLLDAAMTHCLFAQGCRGYTAEMTVRFVAPAPTDRALVLTARELSHKRRIHWLEARLTLGAKLLARASARFIEPRVS